MALYKNPNYLTRSTHTDFDATYSPGDSAPYSGIYRCTGCGKESTSIEGRNLPPQNHHTHTWMQGLILWQLIVAAEHNP
jgi:hypothetical protein